MRSGPFGNTSTVWPIVQSPTDKQSADPVEGDGHGVMSQPLRLGRLRQDRVLHAGPLTAADQYPVANTRAPPNATWNAAKIGGVSIYFQRTQLIMASSTTTTQIASGRGPERGDQKRQRVTDAAERGHQPGDPPRITGAPRPVRLPLSDRASAKPSRCRRRSRRRVPTRNAFHDGVDTWWRMPRRTRAPAWTPSRPSVRRGPAG